MKTQRLQPQKRNIKPALCIKNIVKILLIKVACHQNFIHLLFPLKEAEAVPVVAAEEVVEEEEESC